MGQSNNYIFGGYELTTSKAFRHGHKYQVTLQEYPDAIYPPFFQGASYFLSGSLLEYVTQVCPWHCPHDKRSPLLKKARSAKHCLWRFEDLFIGSCINLLHERVTRIRYHGNETIIRENSPIINFEKINAYKGVFIHKVFKPNWTALEVYSELNKISDKSSLDIQISNQIRKVETIRSLSSLRKSIF